MTLPPELLNRVNKDLKLKVDHTTAELQRIRAVQRLEQEVLSVTNLKLVDAKAVAARLETNAEKTLNDLSEEQRQAAIDAREVDRIKQDIAQRQGNSRDLLRKVQAAEQSVLGTKEKIATAEEISAQNEDQISKWITENSATNSATQQTAQILAAGDARIRALKREAELIRVQVEQMNDAVREAEAESDAIRLQIDDAHRQRLQAETESIDVKAQISSLADRDAELNMRKEGLARKSKELEQTRSQKMAELALEQLQLRVAEADVVKAQRSLSQLDSRKQHALAAINLAQSDVEKSEQAFKMAEVELQLLQSSVAKKRRTVEDLKTTRSEKTEKLSAATAKRKTLEVQCKQLEPTLDNAIVEQNAVVEMLQDYASELKTIMATQERGQRLLQEQLVACEAGAKSTDVWSGELNTLRKQMQVQRDEEALLQRRLEELSRVNDELDVVTNDTRVRVAIEEAKRSESDFELRQQKKAEIESLKAELEEWERVVRQSKQAVDLVAANMRADTRKTAEFRDWLVDCEAEGRKLSLDIAAFNEELNELAIRKQQCTEKGESAYWTLEKLKAKAAQLASGISGQLEDLGALEVQGKLEEMQLDSDQEALKIELHAHDADRHRLHRRLQQAEQQLSLLQSRYADLMTAMQTRVDANAKALDLEDMSLTSPSSPGALQVVSISPEELEARHVLLRAVEREKLQNIGNQLDDQIVATERRLQALDLALSKMREAVQRDHSLLANGQVQDVEALMLLDDTTGATELLREMHEEAQFLQSIRRSYERDVEVERAGLEQEVRAWEAQLRAKDIEHRAARQSLQDINARLTEVIAQRDQVQAAYRALERRGLEGASSLSVAPGTGSATSPSTVEARHRLVRTLIDKQRAIQSTSQGQERLQLQADHDAFVRALSRVQAVAARISAAQGHSGCYFTFRELTVKWGLDHDLSSAASLTDTRTTPTPQTTQRTAMTDIPWVHPNTVHVTTNTTVRCNSASGARRSGSGSGSLANRRMPPPLPSSKVPSVTLAVSGTAATSVGGGGGGGSSVNNVGGQIAKRSGSSSARMTTQTRR